MARPPKWNSPTESVRLPAHAIEACLKLASLLDADGLDEKQYLIQPQPVSFEEYGQIKGAIEHLTARMEAEKLSEGDRLYLFSKLVEEVCKPIKGGTRS